MNPTFSLAVVLFFGFGQSLVDSSDIENSGQSRVVGGKKATKSYPYMVSLESPSLIGPGGAVYNWQHFCGGSIITNRHVLTAAHCVVERDGTYTQKEDMSVLAGTNDLNSGGTRYYPMKNVTHPTYLVDTGSYDIAIITLTEIIRFVLKKVQPIKYSSKETGADVSCILTGWGSTGNFVSGPYPNDLQELNVSTIYNEDCKDTYSSISGNNICTLSDDGHGACSGGPIVDKEKNILVGITEAVSGEGCAIGDPDIFTRVSAFYYWIEKHTKINSMPNNAPVKIPIPRGK